MLIVVEEYKKVAMAQVVVLVSEAKSGYGAAAGMVSLGVSEVVAVDTRVSLVPQQVVQPQGSQWRS